jgi:dihydrofolate synthase/folylpolyglutamate synthase
VTYGEALAYLDGLLLGRSSGPQAHTGVKLDRMQHLCALLGHPERAFPSVLVAGTKGKGSTAAMVAGMATAAGLRAGLYTKPHLAEFRERVRIDGELIPPDDLAGLVAEVRDAIARGTGGPGWPPTYFEASAALASMHFARHRVDLAVMEVGIGGRLDACNVVEPCVSVITTIDYDHTDLFGRDLRRIAAEDAGIIRPRGLVVAARQPRAALRVVEQAAAAQSATLISVGRDVRYRTRRASSAGLRVSIFGREARYRDLTVPLLGRHQAHNAASAVAAAESLQAAGFTVSEAAVREGLAGLRWPARIEIVRDHPTIIADVAHNAVSFRALRAVLEETFTGRRVVLVIGLLGSKDLPGIARIIGPRAAAVVATRAHDPRALGAEEVASAFRPLVPDVHVVDDPVDAIERALAMSGHEDLICVTGSFHVAGPIRTHLVPAAVGLDPIVPAHEAARRAS